MSHASFIRYKQDNLGLENTSADFRIHVIILIPSCGTSLYTLNAPKHTLHGVTTLTDISRETLLPYKKYTLYCQRTPINRCL